MGNISTDVFEHCIINSYDEDTKSLTTSGAKGSLDSFGRLRISNPVGLFDAQFTYDLQPLIYEQITNGSGATISHDATNRVALMTFSSTPTGGKAYMQSYQYINYQPGKSQKVDITFNFKTAVVNCKKFVAYGDLNNAIEYAQNGLVKQISILNGGTLGNQTIVQSNWNLDKLDGTGASGLTMDVSKIQFFTLDFQALYSGRVRCGFDIGGVIVYIHEFNHANEVTNTFLQSATLPIRVGMTCTGTVSTTMNFNCSAVASEGGSDRVMGYEHQQKVSGTAGSDVNAHIMTIRPKTTFNSIVNRTNIYMLEVSVLVTGSNSVEWQLVLGQVLSGTTTFNDVNTTYSSMEYNSAGTLSGSPTIIIDSGFVAASNQTKGSGEMKITHRYPITLDAAGAVRSLGTISLLALGISGTSAVRASLKWIEVR